MKSTLGTLLEEFLEEDSIVKDSMVELKTLISINHLPDSENLNTRSLYGMIQISRYYISVYKIEKFYDSLASVKGKITRETRFDFPGLEDIAERKFSINEVAQMVDNFCDELKEPHFDMGQFYIEGYSESKLISYDDVIDVVGYVCSNTDNAVLQYYKETIKNLKSYDFICFTSERSDSGKTVERIQFLCHKGFFTIVMEDDKGGKYEETYTKIEGKRQDLVEDMIKAAQLTEWEEFIYREFKAELHDHEIAKVCVEAGITHIPVSTKSINLKQVYSILRECY